MLVLSNDLKDTRVWLLRATASNLKSYRLPCTNTISISVLSAVSLWRCVSWWCSPAPRSPLWTCPLPLSVWQVKPLIWIDSVIERFSHSRVEIKVKVSDTQTQTRTHAEHHVLIHSSSPYLVFMTHTSQVDHRCAYHLFETLTDTRHNRKDLLHMNLDAHVHVFFYWTPCRLSQARSQFKSRSTANNVSILVPVPSDADSPKFKTTTGSTKWMPEKNVVQWNIKSFPVSGNKISPNPWFSSDLNFFFSF